MICFPKIFVTSYRIFSVSAYGLLIPVDWDIPVELFVLYVLSGQIPVT